MLYFNDSVVKTITIYTKKQIDELFIQFKNKINQAYQTQQQQAIQQLLIMIQLNYHLFNVRHLAQQFNLTGDIQITSYLQALYVKNTMWKGQNQVQIKNYVLALMKKYQNKLQKYKMSSKFKEISFQQPKQQKCVFFGKAFQLLYNVNQVTTFSCLVTFFKVLIISQIQQRKSTFVFIFEQKIKREWLQIVKMLIKYCRVIQNLKKQQIAISICYWLCSYQKKFIKQCIIEGVVNVLKKSLANKNISQEYGKKIIAFLKLLLLQSNQSDNLFNGPQFETAILKFSQNFDNQNLFKLLRDFMNLVEIKTNLNHKQKLQKFRQLNTNIQKNSQHQKKRIQNLHLLGLYAQSQKISQIIQNPDFLKLIMKLIQEEKSTSVLKQLFSILTFNFSRQKGSFQVIEGIISRLKKMLDSSQYSKELTADKKKYLINFIKMLKNILQNKKYLMKSVDAIKQCKLQSKLNKFSDCTNFKFEKELYQFQKLLKSIFKNSQDSKQFTSNQQNLFKMLQNNILEKAKDFKKTIGQDQLQQIKLLYQLLLKNPNSNSLNINKDVLNAVSKKTSQHVQQNLEDSLRILQNSDSEQINNIKKLINLFSLKFFNELFQNKFYGQLIKDENIYQKNLMIGLNTKNKQIIEEIIKYIILYHKNFGIPQSKQTLTLQFMKKTFQMNSISNPQFDQILAFLNKKNRKNLSFEEIIQQFLNNLSKDKQIDTQQKDELIVGIRQQDSSQKLIKILSSLSKIQPSKKNILAFLQIILQLSKKKELHFNIFELFNNILKVIYANQIQNPSQISQLIKNKIYQILKEIIQTTFNKNLSFYRDLLKISYIKKFNPIISKESIQYSEICLQFSQIKYQFTQQRCENYLNFISNNTDFIGFQACYIIENKKAIQQNFLDKYYSKIAQGISSQNQSHLNFMEKFSAICSNQNFCNYHMINLVDLIFLKNQNQIQKKLQSFKLSPIFLQNSLIGMNKKAHIIYNFNINQKISMSEVEYEQEINQILYFLQVFGNIQNANFYKNNLTGSIFCYYILTFINIYRKHLPSKQVSKKNVTNILLTLDKLKQLNGKQINECKSQLLRLLMLKDQKLAFFNILKESFLENSEDWRKVNTQNGLSHLQVCKKFIQSNGDKKIINRLISSYFLRSFEEEIKNSDTQLKNSPKKQEESKILSLSGKQQISDNQLIKLLKNLLSPPYKYGINSLAKHLRLIKSFQYANILMETFVISSKLFQQDIQNANSTLIQLKEKIVSNISQEYCQNSQIFYIMIAMGKQGSSICLRKKDIGQKGLSIMCDKFIESKQTDLLPHYSKILHFCARSNDQLFILQKKKIVQIINKMYPKKSIRPQYCKSLGDLIGSSSKNKQIQQKFQIHRYVIENVPSFIKDYQSLASTLYAIGGLVYLHPANQKYFSAINNLTIFIDISENSDFSDIVIEKDFYVLSNLVYKNPSLQRTYFDLEIQKKALNVLKYWLSKNKNCSSVIKQILRLLGIIATTLEGGFKLTNLGYLSVCSDLCDKYQQYKQYGIVKMGIDILFNIANQPQLEAKSTVLKLYQQKCTQFLIRMCRKCILISDIVESVLDTYQNLLILDVVLNQTMEGQFLKVLEQIQQTQESNHIIFKKWFRIIYCLFKHEQKIKQLCSSGILNSASNYIKFFENVEVTILNIGLYIIERIKVLVDPSILNRIGFIEFLIQNLKVKNQPSQNISKYLDMLIEMSDKKLLNSHSCTKLFEVLIKRLQLQYKDENAKKLIILLKKIKQKTCITSQTSINLLQFSCFFLTQKQIYLSSRYHKRVRQIISILSYFIAFNIQLQIVFRNQNLMSILHDWIKIDSLMDQDSTITQSCRLCIFVIYNQQKFLILLKSINIANLKISQQELAKGLKCILYRKDGSNKSAMIKYDKQNNQLVAYKLPNGQIKEKYRIPISSLLVQRSQYEMEDDLLYKQSVFPNQVGIFTKKPKMELLATFIGLVGQQLSIRQINVQFSNVQAKRAFINHLKIVATAQFNKNAKI